MRRFLVHMHHGGDDRILRLPPFDKTNGLLKESPYLSLLLALEKLRAGCHQGFHHPNAVLPGAAPGLGDLPLRFGPVLPLRVNKMEIEMAPASIYVGVAGVFLLFALVVSLDLPDLWSLILGKAKNGVLRFLHRAHRLSSSCAASLPAASYSLAACIWTVDFCSSVKPEFFAKSAESCLTS